MKKTILGNLLLLVLLTFVAVFFYFIFKGTENSIFNSGILLLSFLLFYFLGKIICKNIRIEKGECSNLYKALVIISSLAIPITLGFLYLKMQINTFVLPIGALAIVIGFDFKNHIDRALEPQLYKESLIGKGYLAINIAIYIVLAGALLVSFPYLIN